MDIYRRVGALAGMLGPLLFVATFTIEGWLRPGYDSAGMYISALSLGSRGFIQIINFIALGVLLLVFVRGVAADMGKSATVGIAVLACIAISFVVSGPFVMDPVTVLPALMSTHSKIHYLLGAIVFGLGPVSCFAFFNHFRQAPDWRWFRWWTLCVGIAMVIGIGFLKAAQLSASPLHAWIGAIQRAALIPWLTWVFAFGVALYRRAGLVGKASGDHAA